MLKLRVENCRSEKLPTGGLRHGNKTTFDVSFRYHACRRRFAVSEYIAGASVAVVRGPVASAGARVYNGVWGQSPQRDPWAELLVRGYIKAP